MTSREMLNHVRIGLHEDTVEDRSSSYVSNTTTANGNAAGTTLICSNLTVTDDAFNNMEVRLTDDPPGERRRIVDYVGSTGTMHVLPAFSAWVQAGKKFEIGEKGSVSDHLIQDFFTLSHADIVAKLPVKAFPSKITEIELNGASGIADIDEEFVGRIEENSIRVGSFDNVVILQDHERDRLDNDPFLGAPESPCVYIYGSKIHYRPTSATVVKFQAKPNLSAFSFAGGSPLPTAMHILSVKYAIAMGWGVKQNSVEEKSAWEQYNQLLASLS